MRYNAVAQLYRETVVQDAHGNLRPTKGEPKDVFVNMYSIGLTTYMAAQEAGLHADSELQLRTVDYDGENIAVYNGDEYTIERVQDSGEYTRLTLAKRLSNEQ